MSIREDELEQLKEIHKDKLYEELAKYTVEKKYKTVATFLVITTFVLIVGLMVLSVYYTNGYLLIGTLVPIAIAVLYRIYINKQINKIIKISPRNYAAIDTMANTAGMPINDMLKYMITMNKIPRYKI